MILHGIGLSSCALVRFLFEGALGVLAREERCGWMGVVRDSWATVVAAVVLVLERVVTIIISVLELFVLEMT